MRKIFMILLAAFLCGCAVTQVNENYQNILLDDNASVNLRFEKEWWRGYNEPNLNALIELGLKNNIDLAKSAIAVNKALAQAGVLSSDLVPSFSANLGVDTSKNLKNSSAWNENYKSSISLSYEIDLWGKLANARDAALWEVDASKFDLEAARLALINSIADSYFEILYLNESLNLYEMTLKNYRELEAITRTKFELGKGEELSLKQIKNSILSAENRILNAQKSLNLARQTLRNLLSVEPNFELNFASSLSLVRPQGVNLDVPLYTFSHRPDLQAATARIEENLLNLKVSQKNFYPSITVGAGISASGERVSEAAEIKILSGNLGINLPFLNYSKLKANLKISELNFETMKLNYIQKLKTALNEVDTGYKNLQKDEALLQNLSANLTNLTAISEIYKLKFDHGKTELKNYLEARNSELDALSGVLAQRYKLLQDEMSVYKAMAGRAE